MYAFYSFPLVPEPIRSDCREELHYALMCRRHVLPIVCEPSWTALKGGTKMILQRIQWINFVDKGFDVCMPVRTLLLSLTR